VYVADNNDQDVLPIDIATRVPGRPIPVGRYLMALAITPDGRTLYTANDDNTVAILHLR
jgi:DNA-binding beta-propeller fold protein YncE